MLNQIKTVLSLMPTVIAAVKSVEEAVPGSGNGKVKLDMILDTITAVSDQARTLIPIINSMIGVIVAGLNAVGIFKKEEEA